MDLTREHVRALTPAALASDLRTLALIPGSFSPGSATVMLQEAADRLSDTSPSGPSPSDIIYDDMTRAWRNGDTALAGSLADVILRYMANDGRPLTRDRDLYYALRIYARYAPQPSWPSGRPEIYP